MRNTERRNKRSKSSHSDSESEGSEMITSRRRHYWRSIRSSHTKDTPSSGGWFAFALLAAFGTWTTFDGSGRELLNMEFGNNFDFPAAYKPRPTRLRYRDEISLMRHSWNNAFNNDQPVMMMPLVTERQRPTVLGRTMMTPTTSAGSSNQQDPSLEDIELIDVLWRSDIAAEKGARELAPSDQYERDLQLLTEKSIREPLTSSETARYENLAKGYFEDFYRPNSWRGKQENVLEPDLRREVNTPTDEDLDALLEDVTKEGGQLDQLCPDGMLETNISPLMNNVSLGQGIVFNSNNVTELQSYVCDERPQANAMPDNELFSNGTLESSTWPQQTALAPSDIFPSGQDQPVFPAFPPNETAVPIVSTGVHFNHSYQSTAPPPALVSPSYDYYVPNGFSNESSSTCSSNSRSPNYLSEAENLPPTSRYYGKLAPSPNEFHSQATSDDSGIDNNSGTSSPPPGGPRRRGRQSKDEQLAKLHNLPLTAKQIAEMSLSELQKLLKSDNLNESQKTLVKKIRRRGKNKVAARTCRQRRGDRLAKATQDHWANVAAQQLERDD